MVAILSVSASQDVKQTKKLSRSEIIGILHDIETATGWEVIAMIKNIINRKADNISIGRDRPLSSLYLQKVFDDISLTFEKGKKEMRVSIPLEDAGTLLK
jgi:hypothetical protein